MSSNTSSFDDLRRDADTTPPRAMRSKRVTPGSGGKAVRPVDVPPRRSNGASPTPPATPARPEVAGTDDTGLVQAAVTPQGLDASSSDESEPSPSPAPDGLCTCGCGLPLPVGRRRWATDECRDAYVERQRVDKQERRDAEKRAARRRSGFHSVTGEPADPYCAHLARFGYVEHDGQTHTLVSDKEGGTKPGTVVLPGTVRVRGVTELYPTLAGSPTRLDQHRPAEFTDMVIDAEFTAADGTVQTLDGISRTDDLLVRESAWPSRCRLPLRKWQRERTGELLDQARCGPGQAPGRAYDSTGLVRTGDGEWAFVHPGECGGFRRSGPDPTLRVRPAAAVAGKVAEHGYGYLAPDTATAGDDLRVLLRIADVAPGAPGVGAALLGVVGTAPLAQLLPAGAPPVGVYGPTGSLKTAVVQLVSQTCTDKYGRASSPTVNLREQKSTSFAVEQLLHHYAGLPVLLDDGLSGKADSRAVDRFYKETLSTLGSHSSTHSGADRGAWNKGRGGFGISPYPRGAMVVTAEALPQLAAHAGDAARWSVFRLDGAHRVATDVLDDLQDRAAAQAMNRATAGYIIWLLTAPEAAAGKAAEFRAAFTDLDMHPRTVDTYAALAAGVWLLARYAVDVGALTSGQAGELTGRAAVELRTAALAQAEAMGIQGGRGSGTDPAAVFCAVLADELHSRRLLVSSPTRTPDGTPAPPTDLPDGFNLTRLGFTHRSGGGMTPGAWEQGPAREVGILVRDADRRYRLRIPRDTWDGWLFDHLAAAAERRGTPLANLPELRDTLTDAGLLTYSVPMWLWGGRSATRARCRVLDLTWLVEPLDDGADDSPNRRAADVSTKQDDDGAPAPLVPVVTTLADQQVCGGCGGLTEFAIDGQPCHPMCEPPALAEPVAPLPTPLAVERGPGEREPAAPAQDEPTTTAGPPLAAVKPGADADRAPRVGVLAADGLHLSDYAVLDEDAPRHIGDALDLAVAYQLDQLWLHPNLELGIPAELPPDLDRSRGLPHPFVTAAAVTHDVQPAGLTGWMVGWRRPELGERSPRAAVAIAGYAGTAGLAGAPDGATLLATLEKFHRAVGVPFYRSPQRTAARLVKETHPREHGGKRLESTGDWPRAIPPEGQSHSVWRRPLTPAEAGCRFVHGFDANAAHLAACASLPLGIGEPEHRTGGVEFDKRLPGYWLTELTAPDASLPDPFDPQGGGRPGLRWHTTPAVELAVELGQTPQIVEALVWPEHSRYLQAWQERLRDARAQLLADESPAGRAALGMVKATYSMFIGWLARREHSPGHVLYRPDWSHAVIGKSRANFYRRLAKLSAPPFATNVDAAYFATDEPDPARFAATLGLPLGAGLGQYKVTGSGLLAPVSTAMGTKRGHPRTGEVLAVVRSSLSAGAA